ncbi:MAG: glycosyl hydrolase, partial [Flavobacteriales bacterium CG_4_8_14_3_um_filter_35_10]
DGGKTWKNVLFVNDLTGSSDLSLDINNPEVLYSAMWHHQRTPWEMISGGIGSMLYKSIDGGETWFKIDKGLPKEKGKMAIAVSRENSQKVYALIESDSNKGHGGLFVSDDSGENWHLVSGDNRLTQRSWYYIKVFADPKNENTVYVLSAAAFRSTDGGKTWEEIEGTHGDFHDLWINPNNPKNLAIADDGGVFISFNNGKNWSKNNNMPTAQMYRINADNLFPYNIYGGQQDNTSVKIASLSLGRWEISQQDWTYAAGGESAFLAFDPNNPRYVLGGSYLGTIESLDMESKASTNIMEAPIQYLGRAARDMKYLFNWNAPIIRSQHEQNTFFHGAQLVLKTTDMGETWTEFSPDLTRNIDEKQGFGGSPFTVEAVGAENYGTLSYIQESPTEKGVFYTGSDDGFVYLTKDNGAHWTNITPKGLKECLINAIEISATNPATAYIAT